MSNLLAQSATQYLETIILPIVIRTAQLSSDIGVEEFLEFNLSPYTAINLTSYSELNASYGCEDLYILGVSIVPTDFAQSHRLLVP